MTSPTQGSPLAPYDPTKAVATPAQMTALGEAIRKVANLPAVTDAPGQLQIRARMGGGFQVRLFQSGDGSLGAGSWRQVEVAGAEMQALASGHSPALKQLIVEGSTLPTGAPPDPRADTPCNQAQVLPMRYDPDNGNMLSPHWKRFGRAANLTS